MKFCAPLILLSLSIALASCSEKTPKATVAFGDVDDKRPNILLIVADDLGFTDLGAFGGEISTPNIDELAFSGVRLTNFHTGRACQQTRTMLMASSGISAALDQRPRLPGGPRTNTLSLEFAILPELLRDAGYETFMAGKWDLGLEGEYRPAARGFDRSFALLEASSSHFAEYFWRDTLYYEDDGRRLVLDDLPQDFYSTRYYTDKMLEYLQSNDGHKPWFAYLPYTAPHWPLQVPEDWLNRYSGRYEDGYDVLRAARVVRAAEMGVIPRGADIDGFQPVADSWANLTLDQQRKYARAQEIYAAMVEYLDVSIGRIIDYLETSGQLDDTVILFMSDHGASASEMGVGASDFSLVDQRNNNYENFGRLDSFIDHGMGFAEAASAPLKFFKGRMSEGGLRAAAFVRYPDSIKPGIIDGTFMTAMDILPTFLEIADSRHPGIGDYNGRQIRNIKGRSLWPHLTGKSSSVHEPTDMIGWTDGTVGALIRGAYKIINQPGPDQSEPTAWRLYNIDADPSEIEDLSASFPELVEELVTEWENNWR